MSAPMHTPQGEYPREWFRVTKYGGPIERRTFQRETQHMLVTGTRRVAKVTSWETWYPTREEAEAARAAILEAENARRAAIMVRAAAPELLEALEKAPIIGPTESAEAFRKRQDDWLRNVYAPAIAKARGAA